MERFGSKYLDIPNEPFYAFGYGLTYTTFVYSAVSLSQNRLQTGETIFAPVRVTNTGERTGTETVQMYLHDTAASVARPVRELKGFTKVTLNPEESTKVCFPITEDLLRFHDINMEYKSEPGIFEVFIGPDSATNNKAEFELCHSIK